MHTRTPDRVVFCRMESGSMVRYLFCQILVISIVSIVVAVLKYICRRDSRSLEVELVCPQRQLSDNTSSAAVTAY